VAQGKRAGAPVELVQAETGDLAFITEARSIRQILKHLDEPSSPPALAPARGPPLWGIADAAPADTDPRAQHFDPQAPPAPDYQFDQRIAS
jgi:hypothetical protein